MNGGCPEEGNLSHRGFEDAPEGLTAWGRGRVTAAMIFVWYPPASSRGSHFSLTAPSAGGSWRLSDADHVQEGNHEGQPLGTLCELTVVGEALSSPSESKDHVWFDPISSWQTFLLRSG